MTGASTVGRVGFHEQLRHSWRTSRSLLCVGLDPDPARFPHALDVGHDAVLRFCKEIVDATADVVCAFKPQIAHFASQREEPALEQLCVYIRDTYPDVTLILDAKRGDIGSTAEHYAREAFGRYAAHAVTVNPYLGGDSVVPFFAHGGGVIALCRTSNPGGDDLQALDCDGRPLYLRVAEMVADEWTRHGECGLVVGATHPDELRRVHIHRDKGRQEVLFFPSVSGFIRNYRTDRGDDHQLVTRDPLRQQRRRLRRGRSPRRPRGARRHPAPDLVSPWRRSTSRCRVVP